MIYLLIHSSGKHSKCFFIEATCHQATHPPIPHHCLPLSIMEKMIVQERFDVRVPTGHGISGISWNIKRFIPDIES